MGVGEQPEIEVGLAFGRSREVPGAQLSRIGRRRPDRIERLLVADPQAAVEPLLEDDPPAGPRSTVSAARQLERPAGPAERGIVGDPARVVEAEHHLRRQALWHRSPGGLLIGGRNGEPPVVPGQVRGEDRVRLLEGLRPGEPQLADQAVLERPPDPLDAALGLWAPGPDPADVELLERPSDLR